MDLILAGFGFDFGWIWLDLIWIWFDFGWIWLGFWSIIAFRARIALQEVLGSSKWDS